MTVGRAPASLGHARNGDWITIRHASITVHHGQPVIAETELMGQLTDLRKAAVTPQPYIEGTLTEHAGTRHKIKFAVDLPIDFAAVLGVHPGTDDAQPLPESFVPDVTYEQDLTIADRIHRWSYFLGPDGYVWWSCKATGATYNLESWNRSHYGMNWRTEDPQFGPDDIDADQPDDIEPHLAELASQNSTAIADLHTATNLAEAIRAARRTAP
ncbi:hypothetical protein [Couchioplanes azureus]|uniref:hypothetical protein n=1 Tax=Couchioplanes caeruleus TaxID=56438 RepID=UPI001670238D|nr:hypothetical protein [Couchioplanes caeruleus]GGQ83581.1 hypothetical protein GCM10010166_62170 [Couchioplanes caeruleus subsp. azureus]